ncbi:MAG: hypothetical protein DI604_35090 [Delftia acidovorans]|nr:MAG: hypothetical protein DI604_35090 [Delftia acidovorans]
MRKHIDRAAVRKVICEKRFLRRLTDKRPDGSVIPGEAFGPACCRLDMWHWAAESLWGGDYVYCITVTDEGLQLAVDSYSAVVDFRHAEFDVDAQEAGWIVIEVFRRDRAHYQFLHRTARMLLAGIDVRLSSGEMVRGIRGLQGALS